MSSKQEDKRPEPKPRKMELLWQKYLYWDELMQMRKRHLLRLSSITRGKSNMEGSFEESVIAQLNGLIDGFKDPDTGKKVTDGIKKEMILQGETCPIWNWLTSIKGIGDHTAAKLIAQIDDIGKFATVSKLWRFAGYSVINGKAERRTKGEIMHYNSRLKSEVYLVVTNFIKQQTPLYADYYYEVKAEYRCKHPEKELNSNGPQKYRYTDGHIHNMAIRKVAKLFLQHLWVTWREAEGLEVSMPYIHAIKGHTNYIAPPEF